jgi:protein SCO1/2
VRHLPCLLLTLGLAGAAHAAGGKLRSGVFEPPRMAPAISLNGSDGTALGLDRYRGKVVVLGFGFTHCPEVCPTTLAKLAKARKSLGAAGRDLQVVYVTVDPERDDPERMRAYLANFDATFIGGTGTPAQVARVEKDYGIVAERKMSAIPGLYGIDHSSFVYFIDREGRLRAMVPYAKSAEDIAHDAAILLGQ